MFAQFIPFGLKAEFNHAAPRLLFLIFLFCFQGLIKLQWLV